MKQFLLFFGILSFSFFASAQTFSPSNISGLSLWLSSDSVSVINGKVATWYDKSGNNNSAIQTDSLKRPKLVPNNAAINNQPVLKFDGVDDYLQFADITTIKTSFFVFNHDPAFSARDNLFGHTTNAAGCLLSGGSYKLIYYSANWLNISFLNEVSISPYSLAQDSIYNIVTLIPSTDGVANTISHNGYQAYNSWNGNIAEVLFYDKVLSTAERIQVEAYLNNKYAPPVNLGADITIPYGYCNKVLDAGVRFKSFLWSTGDTTQTTGASKTGSYWVEATNVFGIKSRDTVQITYPTIPKPSGNKIVCTGATKLWDTGFPKKTYTFQWQDNSTDSVFNIANAGTYWVRVTDSLGCYKYSDTVTYTIDNFSQQVSLGNDTSLCSGNSIYLKSGAGLATSYLWNDNSTNDSLTITTSGQYWVTVNNVNGCSKRDTINLAIAGSAPTVAFSSTTTCLGNATKFTDLSIPPTGNTITTWLWNFGEPTSGVSDTSTLQNPKHTYASAGIYNVSLTAITNAGCRSSISKTVILYDKPVAGFSYMQNCSGALTQYTDSSIASGSQIITWLWNFGDASSGTSDTSSFQNAIHQYNLIGNYNVKLIAQSTQGCKDSIVKTVYVNPSITNLSPILNSPNNNSQVSNATILFKWNSNVCNSSSQIMVASDAAFSNVIVNQTMSTSTILLPGFIPGNTYYWKVRYFDGILYSQWSSVYKFSVFKPSSISGLSLWLSSDSVGVVNGKVATWYDKSGNNNSATQTDSLKRPKLVPNNTAINNQPVLKFDGVDDYLQFADITTIKTSFFVFNHDPAFSARDNLFGHTTNASGCLLSGGSYKLIYYSANWLNISFLNEVSISPYSLAQDSIYNIVTLIPSTDGVANTISHNGYQGYNSWNGNIAEVLFYDKVLSTAERIQVEAYLNNKYAPPVNLGADITIPYGYCNKVLDAGARFKSFLWSTGDTTQTTGASKTGSYWVEATNVFGIKSRDTVQVTYPSIPKATGSSTLCAGTTKKWDTGFSKKYYSFQWQDNSTDSVFTINNAGQYYVKVTDTAGCYHYSDTVKITLDNSLSIVSLGNDTSLCSGNSIYLKSGAGQVTSYLWNDNSTNDSLTITTSGQYWVTVNNVNGCSKRDTINLAIAGSAPTVAFSSTTTCLGNATKFTDLSIPPTGNTITTWLWNFGEPTSGVSDTSTLQNPKHTYASAGIYNVSLTAITNAGCRSSISKTVILYDKPVAGFSYMQNCSGALTQYTDSSIASGSQIITWLWNFGDASSGTNDTSSFQNAIHQYHLMGNYNVKLIAQSTQGCKDSIVKTVYVTPSVTNFSPILNSPNNNSQVSSAAIMFKWSSDICNSASQILVATDSAFSNIIANPLSNTNSILLPGFISGNTYYWKVRYFDGILYSQWSSVYKFSVFKPSSISGLSLWLSSDSVSVINGKVATWYDKSGNNNSAIQTDSLKRPKLVPNNAAINNQPVLKFDGVDDYLQFADITTIKTSFFVFNHDPAFSARDNLFGHTTNAAGCLLSGGSYKLIYYSANWLNISFLNEVSISPYSLAQDSIYNIVTLIPSTDGVANTISHNGYQAYNSWNGNIAEVLFYDKVLSTAERIQVEAYLNNKYAPPVNLGADITIPYGYCNKVLDAGVRFKSFLWSTGDTTQTTGASKTGSYWVEATNVFGIKSRDTVQITYPTIPKPSGNKIVCTGATKLWDTGFPKKTYTFQWQDNSTDSVFNIANAGTYWVRVTDSLGCYKYSDTVTYTIDNFSQQVSLGNDTSLCSGNSIYLKSGAGLATSYLWNDNSTNDSLTITTSGQYWVTVNNVNGCSKRDTINLAIAGSAPTAAFSSTTTCFGNATGFTDLSAPPTGNTISKWLWNFGESSSGINDTSTLQNPIHMYADTGSYVVKLKITTNAGCGQEINKIIRVYPNPLASFTSANFCDNEATNFVTTAKSYGYLINKWTWDFADPSSGANNVSAIQNPSHAYLINKTYAVQLIVENIMGCKDTAVQTITIKPSPVSDFNYSLACKNSNVQFTDKSTVPASTTIQSSSWNFGDGGFASSLSPKYIFSANVNYLVTHVIMASNGCKDTSIKTVTVYPVPNAYFSWNSACVNTVTDFTDLSVMLGGTIKSWLWDFGNGDTAMTQNAKHTFSTGTNKNIKLTVTSAQGCNDSIIQTIVIHSLPVVNFTFTPSYGTAPLLVNFTNTSSGQLTYLWDFGDTTAQSTAVNTSHTYLSAGSYTISLQGTNNFGCQKTITKTIDPLQPYLDVAITDLSTSLQNNFLNLIAKIVNTGHNDVTSMEFYINVKDGPTLKESWTGLLKSADIMNYNLKSSAYLENQKDYVCVSVLKPNNMDDEVAGNNKFCKVLDESEFKVLDIYPNPSVDELTIPFIIPVEKMITITIYDVNGNIVKNAYSGYLGKGLQMVEINTVELNSGMYACKIEYENQVVIKTFLKY